LTTCPAELNEKRFASIRCRAIYVFGNSGFVVFETAPTSIVEGIIATVCFRHRDKRDLDVNALPEKELHTTYLQK